MSKKILQEILDRAVEQNDIPGGSLLVLKDGKEQIYIQSGKADIENGRPFNRDTIVRLYSATKPITAAAAMILVERGLLDLSDEVQWFLPGFSNQVVAEKGNRLVPVKRNMRIVDLLNMVSGLPYGDHDGNLSMEAARTVFEELEAQVNENAVTTIEVANRLGRQPLKFHPGEEWMYGSSADVLGAVIEVAAHTKFGTFLKTELFDPLEMQDTGFYVPAEKQRRLAKVYDKIETGMAETKTNHLGIRYTQDTEPAFESGGAGLVSTLDDYSRFASMLLDKGMYKGRKILSQQTVAYMTSPSLLPWQQECIEKNWCGLEGYSYGKLMRIGTDPGKACVMQSKGEYGWDGWLGFYFANSPDEKITMLFATQKIGAGTMPVTRKLKNCIWTNYIN